MVEKKRALNPQGISESFNKKRINEKDLDKLFYYSLFDSTSFEEDDEFFPIEKIVDYKNGIRELLKKIFKRESFSYFFENSDSFEEFERRIFHISLRIVIHLKNLKDALLLQIYYVK